jgi:copper chaperone CopZ
MKCSLLLLALAMVFTFVACGKDDVTPSQQGTTQPVGEQSEPPNDGSPVTTTLTVSGMTCRSCVNVINKEVSALGGVIDVTIDLDSGEVVVVHELETSVETIKNAIVLEGFTVD